MLCHSRSARRIAFYVLLDNAPLPKSLLTGDATADNLLHILDDKTVTVDCGLQDDGTIKTKLSMKLDGDHSPGAQQSQGELWWDGAPMGSTDAAAATK